MLCTSGHRASVRLRDAIPNTQYPISLQRGQSSLWADIRFYVVRDINQYAGFVNDEMAAYNAHIGLAVIGLLLPGAIHLRNRVIGVHQQRERQIVLFFELLMALLPVRADAEDDSILFGDRSVALAEPASLDRSTRGVVFRIEVEDYFLAQIVG